MFADNKFKFNENGRKFTEGLENNGGGERERKRERERGEISPFPTASYDVPCDDAIQRAC